MKYAYLSAWVKEFSGFSATLESIWLSQDRMDIILKRRGSLILVLSAKNSYMYHSDLQGPPEKSTEIWNFLKGANLSSLRIEVADRIISFKLTHKNIYGETNEYEAYLELMPPRPNVIICKRDGDRLIVQDALVKYGFGDNPKRQILPHQPYFQPQGSFVPEPVEINLPGEIGGVQAESMNDYIFKLAQMGQTQEHTDDGISRKIRYLHKELKHLQRKYSLQQQDLLEAEQAAKWQAYAEAIKPNLQSIAPGQAELRTIDYFDPELQEISVPLLPEKSPRQNLEFYLKKYRKAKTGRSIIQINLSKTDAEMEAVNQLITQLEAGDDIDLEVDNNIQDLKQSLSALDKLLHLRIGENWHIYIGRKAKENDFITTKVGKPQDWWFHSRIYRGAHVLLRNYKKQEPQPDLIAVCASLAAWYSTAKFSTNVPVDYTQIRYVRKPRGSAPGFVTYTNYRTFFAEPKDLRRIRTELGL